MSFTLFDRDTDTLTRRIGKKLWISVYDDWILCTKEGRSDQRGGGGSLSSAIEYFNYCIFYNEFNDYDILNLPLVNGKERITFKGLKELIKRLQAESNRKLSVKIFENSKSEYQVSLQAMDYIGESVNIIRGINKTEGHVRTYFESNYRTSRKVVEDLLIEEIIQVGIPASNR